MPMVCSGCEWFAKRWSEERITVTFLWSDSDFIVQQIKLGISNFMTQDCWEAVFTPHNTFFVILTNRIPAQLINYHFDHYPGLWIGHKVWFPTTIQTAFPTEIAITFLSLSGQYVRFWHVIPFGMVKKAAYVGRAYVVQREEGWLYSDFIAIVSDNMTRKEMGRNVATTLASLQCHHPIRHSHRPQLICKTSNLFYQNLKGNQKILHDNLYTRLVQVQSVLYTTRS